jgi:hypothetical protein
MAGADLPLGLTAAQADAYRLAFATQAEAMAAASAGTPADVAAALPARDVVPPAADASMPASSPPAADADVAADVPIPTPRPGLAGDDPPAGTEAAAHDAAPVVVPAAPAQDSASGPSDTPPPQIVALADPQSPAPTWDATGEIPCARYVGQPMTRCQAGVKRSGEGKADVTVTWPDGGTRTIGFYDGKPAGANSRGEFRFTREGDLNMIRIGVSERFEITDTLAFGD